MAKQQQKNYIIQWKIKKKKYISIYSINILFILGVRFWPPHQNMLTFTTIIGEFTC